MQPVRRTQGFTNGEASFGGPPGGFVWSVQVNVPTATNSDTFQLYINGEQLTSTAGTGLMGPVQVFSGETLTIKSSTVAAGTVAFLYGQVDKQGQQPSGIFPLISGGVVTTSGGYPLDPPQSGQLSANIDAAVSGTVIFSITLSTGTWLVTFNGTVLSTAAGCSPGFYIVAGSATASFSGASACQGYAASDGEEKNLSFTSLINVMGGGTLNITFYNNNTNINILATVAAGTETPSATGWTATRVA